MDQLNFFEALGAINPNLREHESNDWKWSFKDYPDPRDIKVFSCFACGGGSTMGYKLAGCKVIGDLEIDPRVNNLYIKNHNPKYNYVMDIRDFNNLEDLPEELYNLDILDGSPPCTTFSTAGERSETWGKVKKFREGQVEQTLDDLSFHFINTAKKLKPKMVIMENVEGLLLGEAWKYVQDIYKELDLAGYRVNHYLLKGETLGVPQKRHRVFFIAVRKDIDFDFYKLDMNFNYKPVLFGEVRSEKGKELKGELTLKRLENLQAGDTCIGDITQRLENKWSDFNTKIIWDNEIATTLRAAGSAIRAFDKKLLSNEDVINISTFAQDYDFMDQQPNYVCGMSVPPIMIKRLVTRIIDTGVFN